MQHNFIDKLAHVYWIGGSPCAGKSSIARKLAQRYHLNTYNCDDTFARHTARADSDHEPVLYGVSQMTWDDLWMRPVELQIVTEIVAYCEEFEMIVQDLLAYPPSKPVIAEGAALLPDCVIRYLAARRQAVWVVPSEQFLRTHYTPERRPWMTDILAQCSEPDQAYENWMARDVGFAGRIAGRAQKLGLHMIEVDGTETLEENAQRVAASFGLTKGGNDEANSYHRRGRHTVGERDLLPGMYHNLWPTDGLPGV